MCGQSETIWYLKDCLPLGCCESSASQTLFGFDFQVNAAIVLMLEKIAQLEALHFVGVDDNEIILDDKSNIVAQAKSVVKSRLDFRSVRSNFKKAAISLSDADHTVISIEPTHFKPNDSGNIRESTIHFSQELTGLNRGFLTILQDK